MIKRGNLQSELSQYQVIKLLRTRGQVTRPDLVRITGLSRPTVDKIVEFFKKERIISETGIRYASSRSGRRPVVLSLDSSSKVIVGVDFECPRMEVILSDLSSSIIELRECDYAESETPQRIVSDVIRHIREMIATSGRSISDLLGIGVALPGVLDVRSGVSLNIERMKNWNDVPVARLLAEALGVPAFIDNDVNLMALAERTLGTRDISDNFIYVAERQGIGAGIIMGGQIYRGNFGNSGFLGHTSIDPNGRRCRCGNFGCLELYAGETAMVQKYKERLGSVEKPNVSRFQTIGASTIYAAAAAGDPSATAVLEEVGNMLGVGIANTICILDINQIVLGGTAFKAGDDFYKAVRDSVIRRLEPAFRTDMEMGFSTVNEHAATLGATLLVLEDIFSAPNLESVPRTKPFERQ